MSLKDNIDMVKDELNSEEKFFEKAVMTEKFIKKYKNVMISAVVGVVIIVGANIAYSASVENRITSANLALSTLFSNANDANAISDLKSLSPNLHDVWAFSQAITNKDFESLNKLKDSKAPIVKDLIRYELAKDEKELEKYSLKQDAIFRDLALVQASVILLEKNRVKDAHDMLLKISKNSSLYKVSTALLHYGVK